MKRKKNVCKNSYVLLTTSWKHQAKIFFGESTLHGVRYIAETGRPLVEKLLWFTCVAIGAIATMVIIVSLWEKFQTNPTITGLDTDFHTWDVPFPAVTVCQSIPSNLSNIEEFIEREMPDAEYKDDMTELLSLLTTFSYSNMANIKKFADKKLLGDDVDIKNYIFPIMNQCKSVFDTCSFKSDEYNCCENFVPVFTERGFCYTFNSRQYEKLTPWSDSPLPDFKVHFIKETDSKWSISFAVRNKEDQRNIAIFIHNSDEVPSVDVKPQHVWDFRVNRMLFSVKQTYTTEDATQLSIRQRHCVFEREKQLKFDSVYTYTGCTQQCRMDNAIRYCGCIPHFYPENANEDYRHCRFKELSCLADHVDKINDVDRCNCHLACGNTVYEIEKFNENPESEKAEMEAEFVSWPMVRYKREVLFGWVDLLVSFGGIAGLFLGFSLLSGVEVLYYFTMRACCMVYKEEDHLRQLHDKEKQVKRQRYDLSLVPYFITTPKVQPKKPSPHFLNFPSKLETIHVKPYIKVVPPYGIQYTN